MKKNFFALVLLGMTFSVYSQSNNLAFVKAGINSNSIQDEGLKENTVSPFVGVGLNFGDKLSFQPELLLNIYRLDVQNSGNDGLKYDDYRYNGNVIKVSLPLLVKYEIIERLSAFTGVTPSLILINKDKSEYKYSIRESASSPYKFDNDTSFNGAITIGAEFKIKSNFFIDARYNFSPTFMNEMSDDAVIFSTGILDLHEKSSIQIGLGYKFI